MKKALTFLLITLLCLGLFCACTPDQPTTNTPSDTNQATDTVTDSSQNTSTDTDSSVQASTDSVTDTKTDETEASTDTSEATTDVSDNTDTSEATETTEKTDSSEKTETTDTTTDTSDETDASDKPTDTETDVTDSDTDVTTNTEQNQPQGMEAYVLRRLWKLGVKGWVSDWVCEGEVVWATITNGTFSHLAAFDTVTGDIPHAYRYSNTPVAVTLDGGTVWVLIRDGWAYGYDTATGKETDRHYLQRDSIAFQVNGSKLYYVNSAGIFVYDADTNKTETIDSRNDVECILLDPASHRLYAIAYSALSGHKGVLLVYDTKTLKTLKTVTDETIIPAAGGKMFLEGDTLILGGSVVVNCTDFTLTESLVPGRNVCVTKDYIVTYTAVYDRATKKKLRSLTEDNFGSGIVTPEGRLFLWSGEHIFLFSYPGDGKNSMKELSPGRDDTSKLSQVNPLAAYTKHEEHVLENSAYIKYLFEGKDCLYALNRDRLYRLSPKGEILAQRILPAQGWEVNCVGDEVIVSLLNNPSVLVLNATDLSIKQIIALPAQASGCVIVGDYVYYSGYDIDRSLTRYNVKTKEIVTFGDVRGTARLTVRNGELYAVELGSTSSGIFRYDLETLKETGRFDEHGIESKRGWGTYFLDGKIYVGSYCFDEKTLKPLYDYGDTTITDVTDDYIFTTTAVFDRKTNQACEDLPVRPYLKDSYRGGLMLPDGTLVQEGSFALIAWSRP
ncbi:MAG: hypothetical protein II337_00005 [Clostridia bacterium]|nr:hypothetical protein [Clostridia bacterium]